jgi:hypothetical protein
MRHRPHRDHAGISSIVRASWHLLHYRFLPHFTCVNCLCDATALLRVLALRRLETLGIFWRSNGKDECGGAVEYRRGVSEADSGVPEDVFTTAYRLRDAAETSRHDREALTQHVAFTVDAEVLSAADG